MNKQGKILALAVILLSSFSIPSVFSASTDDGDTLKLHDFYEQNGDCYLLIGNDKNTSKSGVHQLNNLTSGITRKLYNPGNAYGITAGLTMDNKGKIEKDLYTFTAKNRRTQSANGKITTRPMLTTWSYGAWQSDNRDTPNNVAPAIVHRYHTLPNAAQTGVGNHTSGYGLYKFNYKCIPCSIRPTPDGVDDEGRQLYSYKIGVEWYHSVDYPAYSRYTYCTKGTSGSFNQYRGKTDSLSGQVIRDLWMDDEYSVRRANDPDSYWWSTRYGGWVHYVAQENVTEKTDELWLQKYIVNKGFDNSFNKKVTKVVVGATSRLSLKGECIDGCISEVNNMELPGQPAPYLDTAYSAQTKASYVYTRDRGDSKGKIEGLQSDKGDIVVGNGDTMTTRFVGVSSRNATGNFVYLLGSEIINKWMTESNCPASMLIADPEDLADVAVSDQWWQNGGIVYAYDKRKKKIYCFVRNEKAGKSDPPTEISADIGGGRLPDKIGADGFGSLYLIKTDFEPNTTDPRTYFAGPGKDKDNKSRIIKVGEHNGEYIYRAYYEQNIVKSVYKKPYGSDTAPERLAGGVIIDTNVYFRDFVTPSNKPDDPDRKYQSAVMPHYEVNDQSGDYRSELAVINCPTPPRPDHVNAICDNNGPMVYSERTHTYSKATPNSAGYFRGEEGPFYFMVENAPYFDSNLLNIGNTEVDIDGDGKIGRFPNTVKKDSVEYYWQIRRTHKFCDGTTGEPFGLNKVDEYAPENQVYNNDDGSHIVKGGYMTVFPILLDKGKYKVGVKAVYKFYDYSKLPVGALASEKEVCLSGNTVAGTGAAPTGRPEDDGFSWEEITFDPGDPPAPVDGECVIMTNAGKGYLPGEACGGSCSHPQCQNRLGEKQNPTIPTFILDGHSLCKYVDDTGRARYPESGIVNWGLKLRENTYNKKTLGLDRITILTGAPPDPNDPKMIDGTLRWLNPKDGDPLKNNLEVSWTAELKRGSETLRKITLKTSDFKLSLAELRTLFPVPSEPMCYTLDVSATSMYAYSFMDFGPRLVAGGKYVYDNHRADKVMSFSISAKAKVCVTDNQKPSLMVYDPYGSGKVIPGLYLDYNSKEDFVKAATGETIKETDSAKNLSFYVVDNNPMANFVGAHDCPQGTTDKYHYDAADSRLKKLRVNFSPANMVAHLYNDNCSRAKVKTGYQTTNAEKITSGGFSFANCVVANAAKPYKDNQPSNLVSIFKYSIKADKLSKFTSDTDHRIKFDFANNNAGYSNLTFGIRWREACNNSSSNPLEITENDFKTTDVYSIGRIVSVDNDRPNIYIKAIQEKYPTTDFVVPILAATKADNKIEWKQTVAINGVNYSRQGEETWDLKPGAVSTSNFSNFNESIRKSINKEIFDDEHILLADVPVTFEVFAEDNAGDIKYNKVVIRKVDGKNNGIYAGDGSKNYKAVNHKKIQCVFRETDADTATYCIEAEVQDNAKAYPDKAENAKNATSDKNSINKRTIKAYFKVVPSRLDYRILDREIKH